MNNNGIYNNTKYNVELSISRPLNKYLSINSILSNIIPIRIKLEIKDVKFKKKEFHQHYVFSYLKNIQMQHQT